MKLAANWIAAGLLLAQRAPVEDAWDLLAKGDRPNAIRVLQRILKTTPTNADARLLLGSIFAEDGDRDGSIAHLTEAVRLRPKSAEAQNALGEALSSFHEAKSAKAAFEKAVTLDPKFAQAKINLGLALLESGEFQTAATHLDSAIALLGKTPDSAYPRYLRAKAATEANDPSKAAELLTEAVTLRPDFAEAWSDLGQARKSLADDPGTLVALKQAVALAPNGAVAQYRLGAEYLRHGETSQAIQHLKIAATIDPTDQSTLYSLQRALRQSGQTQEADQVAAQLAELLRKRDKVAEDDLKAITINNQGTEFERSGNLKSALEKYQAALILSPDHVGIRVNVAAALLRLGQIDAGIAQLQEAARRDPENQQIKTALEKALKARR